MRKCPRCLIFDFLYVLLASIQMGYTVPIGRGFWARTLSIKEKAPQKGVFLIRLNYFKYPINVNTILLYMLFLRPWKTIIEF